MIFLSVGAQSPFDRLVSAVDAWAGERQRTDIFAQVGRGGIRPRNFESVPMISPEEFRSRVRQAEVVIAHAGMGTIITALELSKPLLVMPRRPERRETRNAHQIATARCLLDSHRAAVAWNEGELPEWLDRLEELARPVPIARYASPMLLDAVGRFIEGLEPLEAPASIPMPGEPQREVERRRVA